MAVREDKDGLGLFQTPSIKDFVVVVILVVQVPMSIEEGGLIFPISRMWLNATTTHLLSRINPLPATDFLREEEIDF